MEPYMYRVLEYIHTPNDIDVKTVIETIDQAKAIKVAKSELKRTSGIRLQVGYYEFGDLWECIKQFDDIDINEL